ncbi:MAG: response regulator transcription factor [Actinomycetota bacterium]
METQQMLVVVEDEPDIRFLVRVTLGSDRRFEVLGEAASATEAIELARTVHPNLIILDHGLEGEMTGLEAAPLLKQAAPNAKILLFTANEHLRGEALLSPSIDAFLVKTEIRKLLAMTQELLGLTQAG